MPIHCRRIAATLAAGEFYKGRGTGAASGSENECTAFWGGFADRFQVNLIPSPGLNCLVAHRWAASLHRIKFAMPEISPSGQ
jgi:hypothetical protein